MAVLAGCDSRTNNWRAIGVFVALCFCFGASPLCVAQELGQVIRLSADETAKAKQLGQNVKDTEERQAKAKISWEQFYKNYQAAHPDLPGLRLTMDFRLAFSLLTPVDGDVPHATSIELTPEERQKAATLYGEMVDSEHSATDAQRTWQDYQHELILNHIGNSGSGTRWLLATGKQVVIGPPWADGLAFTSDFRLAFPRQSD